MKRAVLLFAGAGLAVQAANAQFVKNDLYLGFNANGAASDYIINLGAYGNIVGGNQVVDLSGNISAATFNSIFGSPTGIGVGVVGAGATTGLQHTYDIYLTALRNGAGNNAVPNSTLANPVAGANDAQAYSTLTQGSTWPNAAGASSGSTTTPDTSWTALVGPVQISGNYYSATGNNPISDIGASGIIYEDLYYNLASSGSAYQYLGYFTLDFSGSSPKLTFTPQAAAVAEPPVITSIQKAGGTVTLVWSSVSGQSYQMQYTASLSPTDWINIGSATPASGTTMTNTDNPGTDAQRFYRVVLQ